MALSKAARSRLPAKDFAGPDRSFPVENKAHAKAALMDRKDAPKADRAAIKRKADAVLRGKKA
jgi:hypothetical protein